jgi:hypothetical protein
LRASSIRCSRYSVARNSCSLFITVNSPSPAWFHALALSHSDLRLGRRKRFELSPGIAVFDGPVDLSFRAAAFYFLDPHHANFSGEGRHTTSKDLHRGAWKGGCLGRFICARAKNHKTTAWLHAPVS